MKSMAFILTSLLTSFSIKLIVLMMRKAFILYRRKGFKNYYAAFWDAAKQDYSCWRSAGSMRNELGRDAEHLSPASKAGADAIAAQWYKRFGINTGNENPLFSNYLIGFWSDDGHHLKNRHSMGRPMSAVYIKANRSAVHKVVDWLGSRKLESLRLRKVNAMLMEEIIHWLSTLGISNRRVNAIMQAVTVPLNEAERLGLISVNPAKRIKRLPVTRRERVILRPEEVRAFFGQEWTDPRQKAINLLAATTGMRLGECRGLKVDCVHDDWIDVKRNWQDGEGLKLPKGNKPRIVPVPSRTVEALHQLASVNPWRGDFVFWGSSPDKPIGKRSISNTYKHMLETVGIAPDEIKKRGLSFHAWRHWYNSMLRGRVADHALRRLTGHSSVDMTEHYTAITDEQRHAVAQLAEELV